MYVCMCGGGGADQKVSSIQWKGINILGGGGGGSTKLSPS